VADVVNRTVSFALAFQVRNAARFRNEK